MGIKEEESSRKDATITCDYAKHYEPYDWCTLSDNPCFKDTGDCDEYNDLLKEDSNDMP
ncbi:hypothetical protein LCGC14_2912530 [marine sediment metagenome]|uniref:Uncharacterized protein n=1 Tax=marine sediment metagenome TaxID=412755 RepID=A0A0F9AHD8_9ZZZZ